MKGTTFSNVANPAMRWDSRNCVLHFYQVYSARNLTFPCFFIFFPTSQVKQALWLVSVSITCTAWNETEKTHTHTTEVQPQQTQEQNHISKSSQDIRLKSSGFTSHHSTIRFATRHPKGKITGAEAPEGTGTGRPKPKGLKPKPPKGPKGLKPKGEITWATAVFLRFFSCPKTAGENSPWLNKRGWKELQWRKREIELIRCGWGPLNIFLKQRL